MSKNKPRIQAISTDLLVKELFRRGIETAKEELAESFVTLEEELRFQVESNKITSDAAHAMALAFAESGEKNKGLYQICRRLRKDVTRLSWTVSILILLVTGFVWFDILST